MFARPTPAPSVALLVHACDRYEFLYPGFAWFFGRYWPRQIRCAYYFATEEKPADIAGFQNIRSGRGEWSDRLRRLLEQLTEDYVLYFQEDVWLSEPVQAGFFEELFALAAAQGWQHVKLHSAEMYRPHPTPFTVAGLRVAQLDNAGSGYLMSHQITLWNREYLLKQLALGPGEHPWRNERRGTKRLRRQNDPIRQLDYFAENGKPAINENEPAAPRSAYYTVSVNSVLHERVRPYITQLQAEGGPAEHAYAAALADHLARQLTHDGLPKPRKEDFLQKIKRRFRAWRGR